MKTYVNGDAAAISAEVRQRFQLKKSARLSAFGAADALALGVSTEWPLVFDHPDEPASANTHLCITFEFGTLHVSSRCRRWINLVLQAPGSGDLWSQAFL